MKKTSSLTDWAGYCYECNKQIRAEDNNPQRSGFTEFYIEDDHKYCLRCGNKIENN